MSYILKSLKKLENEIDRNLLSSPPPVVSARQTLRRQVTFHRRNRVWFFSLIIVCLLAASGWWLARFRSVSPPSLPASSSPPVVEKPEKMARKTIPPIASPPQRPASGFPATQPATPPSPAESLAPGMPSPLERMRQAIVSRTTHSLQNRGKEVSPERAETPEATAVQNPGKSDQPPSQRGLGKNSAPNPISPVMAPARAASPTTPSPAVEKDASELPPLSADAGLKLEALAWAAVPESRFVVINSQIVREGDIIEGAKVERIETEQVVIRKDGKLWQLRHRPQR